MNISDVFDRLNFFINKYTGAWYTIPELENLTDSGQLALYSDYKPKYATSQLIKDALSPFRAFYDFTPTDSISGYIVVPADRDYLDLLDLQITYMISNLKVYYGVTLVNEDERANRLNSQIDPVTITSPVGEQTAPRYFKMTPLSGYTGTVTFFKRPVKPVFGYSTVSGRIIVYDPLTSTQLQWRDTEIIPLCLKALQSIGINLTSVEIGQFAELKTGQNWAGQNRL